MNKSTYRLSDESKAAIAQIKADRKLKTDSAAIEHALSAFVANEDLAKQFEDMRRENRTLTKHVNELRRGVYVITALLNAMSLEMNLSTVPMHHQPAFRSPALLSANENLSVYLTEVQTKNESLRVKKGAADG